MRFTTPMRAVVPAAAAAALCAAAATHAGNGGDDDEQPFAEASIYFELNDTDGDLGIHALIDGEPWKKLEIEDAHERRLLNIRLTGRLRRQGLTELFFESAEPPFDELSPEDFFRRFPEGTYEIEAKTLEGGELESEVEVSHVMPGRPGNVTVSGVPKAEDCDVEPLPEVGMPIVIDWDAVTESHPDIGTPEVPVEVDKYQVVIEREEPTPLVLSVDLSPDVTQLEIPPGLVSAGEEIKFEILVRGENGNQTAVESCFVVEE